MSSLLTLAKSLDSHTSMAEVCRHGFHSSLTRTFKIFQSYYGAVYSAISFLKKDEDHDQQRMLLPLVNGKVQSQMNMLLSTIERASTEIQAFKDGISHDKSSVVVKLRHLEETRGMLSCRRFNYPC